MPATQGPEKLFSLSPSSLFLLFLLLVCYIKGERETVQCVYEKFAASLFLRILVGWEYLLDGQGGSSLVYVGEGWE